MNSPLRPNPAAPARDADPASREGACAPGPPSPPAGDPRPPLALLARDLNGGGVQRVMLKLAAGLARRGRPVDLLVCRAEGALLAEVPPGVRLVPLERGRRRLARLLPLLADPGGARVLLPAMLAGDGPPSPSLPYLAGLVRHLRRERPAALVSGVTQANLEAVWARRLARTRTPLLLTEHVHFTAALARSNNPWRRRHLPGLVRRAYPQADAVVAVSAGLADDLARAAGLDRRRLRVVFNPVVDDEVGRLAAAPVDHPWFRPGGPPVVLGAGRLSEQKDFPTLVRAFAAVRVSRPARLVILGDATDPARTDARRAELRALAASLGVAGDVDLPGFVPNPYAYMARAAVFVLSSAWEGFGNVLVEAMACGCPVVSTDCPSGPAEILEGGRHGPLVPVGDAAALAAAVARTLDAPSEPGALRRRAAEFSVDRAAGAYLDVLAGLSPGAAVAAPR